MKVEDPDGQTWRVSRRWVPWRRRGLKDAGTGDASGLDLLIPDDPIALILIVVVLLLAFLGPFVMVPFVIAGEFLLLLLLVPFAVLGRIFFGRQWCVELRRGWTPWTEQPAGDWRASAVRIHEIADATRRGVIPPRTLGGKKDSGI